jgi:TraR antiactivator
MSDSEFDPFHHLYGSQPTDLIRQIAVEEIRKHRRLTDEGQVLYDAMRRSNEDPVAEHAYLSKMVEVLGQQMALSKILDILGYIPEVPATKPH